MSPTYVGKILETLEMQSSRSVTAPVDTLKKVTGSEQVSPKIHKLTEELLVSYHVCSQRKNVQKD